MSDKSWSLIFLFLALFAFGRILWGELDPSRVFWNLIFGLGWLGYGLYLRK